MEKKRRGRRIILVIVAVTSVIVLNIFSQIEDWKRDLTTNFARLSEDADDPLLRSFTISGSPSDVETKISRWADHQSKWTLISSEVTETGVIVHLTHSSSLLRFTDDIHVGLHIDGKMTRVEAESRSRVGKGDLGQNPRNLRELVSGLRESR